MRRPFEAKGRGPAMPVRSFDEDARAATASALPVPRGIVFRYDPTGGAQPPSQEAARAAAAGPLPGWQVRAVEGLDGWFEAQPPALPAAAATQPIPLADFWERLRALRAVAGVREAQPLLLIANPLPAETNA